MIIRTPERDERANRQVTGESSVSPPWWAVQEAECQVFGVAAGHQVAGLLCYESSPCDVLWVCDFIISLKHIILQFTGLNQKGL